MTRKELLADLIADREALDIAIRAIRGIQARRDKLRAEERAIVTACNAKLDPTVRLTLAELGHAALQSMLAGEGVTRRPGAGSPCKSRGPSEAR